jgi:hypothetical protein
MSVIGDTQSVAVQPVVAALPIPIVTKAALSDVEDAVNITLYSGKKAGACYIMEDGGDYFIVVAQGSAPTDKWQYAAGEAVTGTSITPA